MPFISLHVLLFPLPGVPFFLPGAPRECLLIKIFFLILKYIYLLLLAVLGLRCSMQTSLVGCEGLVALRHVGSESHDQGLEGVFLTTGPQGRPWFACFLTPVPVSELTPLSKCFS